MQSFFNLSFSIGTIALQIFLIATLIAWIVRGTLASWVARHSTILMRCIFISAALGSLVFQYALSYPPCLLCWYQRLAIFPIAILACTGDFRTSKLLRIQTIIFAVAGFAIAIFHNIIDIFPTGLDVCGANGPSCLARYVYEFGYITIPMMSATVLLAGIIIPLLARRYPHDSAVQLAK